MLFNNILQLATKTKEIEIHVIPMRKTQVYTSKKKKKNLRGEQKENENAVGSCDC